MTERIVINGVAYIRQAPVIVPQKPRRWYGGASLSEQNKIDGFDDTDPEILLNRQDDERDNRFFINTFDDVATPCYEQDLDYADDRFPQYEPDQVFPVRKTK
jgi:hypothetical protein